MMPLAPELLKQEINHHIVLRIPNLVISQIGK